jgi:acyl-CoA dehydrogenase
MSACTPMDRPLFPRCIFSANHEAWRATVRGFLETEVLPHYDDEWHRLGRPPREFWRRAGEVGILGIGVPERFGGRATFGFKHSAIVTEEGQRLGLSLGGVRVQTDICMPYFLEYASEEQQQRWLPRLASGDAVAALAISEPAAGSDVKAMSTRAVRRGEHYIVDGAKTFISNGLSADIVILAVKTDREKGRRGISLLVVEASAPGFQRGTKLEKVGQKTQDLCELFFSEMLVPLSDRLGEEGHGFEYLTRNLAQERLSIAVNAQAAATAAVANTISLLGDRAARPGQHAKFELAACATDARAGQALVDQALEAHEAGELQPADAAAVKLFCTELQGRVVDRCLQVVGPQGCVYSSPLGRAYVDARVTRIYGGSSEIMKVIVAQSLGL